MKKTLAAVVNHNLPVMTDKLWESLYPYRRDDYDMILIDNGSREDGKSKYTTHETGHNTYYGGALNIMFQHFLDSDEYDSLTFIQNDLIIQGSNYIRSLRKELKGDYKIISPCGLQIESQCKWRQMHCWNSTKVRDVKWVDGIAPLYHKDFIEEVRQFSDELIYGWGQDVLSGIICKEKGWKIGVVDWCPVIHHSAHTYKEGKSDIDLTEYCQRAEGAMFNYFQSNNLMDKFNKYREYGANYYYK